MLLIGFLAKHWTVITLLLRLLGQHMHTLWYIPLFTEVSTWLWRKTTKGHICGLRWCSFSLCEICFFTWEAKCIFCPSKHSVQWIENFTFLCLKTELLIVFLFFFSYRTSEGICIFGNSLGCFSVSTYKETDTFHGRSDTKPFGLYLYKWGWNDRGPCSPGPLGEESSPSPAVSLCMLQ